MKIIIIGAGEVGFHIASRLSFENKDVVIIDNNPEAIQRISDNIDVQVILGSGCSPVILQEAGIKEAEILLAITNSDEVNLTTCLIANLISPSTKKLARIRNPDYDNYHELFSKNPPHIDTIINPETEAVKTIEELMSVPGAVDVEEFAEGKLRLIGIILESSSKICNKNLSELNTTFGDKMPLIVAIVRNDELIIPGGNDKFIEKDIVYFISDKLNLPNVLKFFDIHSNPIKNALIIGGGSLGFRLAKQLEKKNMHTRLIEKNQDRCEFLAENLSKTIVLNGDGSDQDLLKEENIQNMDIVITLTNDEETNILVSLLSKRMGAGKTISKISKFSYYPLLSTIGIMHVVSPRLSAVNSIIRHIRRGKVISAKSIKGEQAEVLEAIAMETSDIVGKPLRKISIPKNVLVISILRKNKIIIPSGNSIIKAGDRIIIFAKKEEIPKVEKILAVKLEFF